MQLHITRPLLLRRPLTQLRRRAWQPGGLARKGLGRAYKVGGLPPLAPKASASELPRFWYGGVPTPPLTQEPTGLFVLPLLPPPGRLELRHASGVCPGWGGRKGVV